MSKFGKTKDFPEGKIDPSDEGGLQFGIATDHAHGCVIVNFGSPVAWLGLPPDHARQLAALLIKHADEIGKRPQ